MMNIFIPILFSIFAFDKLLSYQRTYHNAEWLKDDKPFILWYSNDNNFWEMPFIVFKLYYKWIFCTPEWAIKDQKALPLFKSHR